VHVAELAVSCRQAVSDMKKLGGTCIVTCTHTCISVSSGSL
jgi:hypothetical protein